MERSAIFVVVALGKWKAVLLLAVNAVLIVCYLWETRKLLDPADGGFVTVGPFDRLPVLIA